MRRSDLRVSIAMITLLLVIGIYRWYENLQHKRFGIHSISDWSSRTVPFVLDNRTGWIVFQSDRLSAWLNEQADSSRIFAIQNVIKRTLCQFQITTGTAVINSEQSCCNQSDSIRSDTGVDCLPSLGTLPTVTSLDSTKPRIPTNPPDYQHNQIYVAPTEEPDVRDEFTCTVNLEKRYRVYELLRNWIDIAEKHKLVWWLNHGSLLGAVRNGDFIPYDHDADISVLGSAEPTIRRLATGWQNLSFNKINLIVREQDYCVNDHMPRLNCQGIPVRYQMDPCAFCTPLARLISGYFNYFDIFLVNIELRFDSQGTPVDMGIVDEVTDRDRGTVLSYPLDYIFPLTTCTYMGLRLPCPRKSQAVLTHLYGENYMQPSKLCYLQSGRWYNT